MDSLRVALLIIGVLVVGAVYLTTRKRDAAVVKNSSPETRVEPRLEDAPESRSQPSLDLNDLPSVSIDDPIPDDVDVPSQEEPAVEAPESGPEVPQKVITLRIVAKKGDDFSAERMILALRDSGLVHGKFGIFHKLFGDDPDAETVFAAANLVEPGSFDLKNLKDQRLPGLSFFLVRPGPGRGVDGYDKMVETARSIAITLGGDLVDRDGSTFSIQRERFMREELIQYELDHLNLT
ncbi:MAG: cell division protein ZipA C-terminal FtsZ-binding domain-containing protein [Pseudomonadota bacterium]